MKVFVKIILVSFVLFLLTPTIIEFMEKAKDSYGFYEIDDSDNSLKELKFDFKLDSLAPLFEFPYLTLKWVAPKILSNNFSKHGSVWETIFIPPPDNL